MITIYWIVAMCVFIAGSIFVLYDRAHFRYDKLATLIAIVLISVLWFIPVIMFVIIVPLFGLYLLFEYIQERYEDWKS
jgi:hypothetical protein